MFVLSYVNINEYIECVKDKQIYRGALLLQNSDKYSKPDTEALHAKNGNTPEATKLFVNRFKICRSIYDKRGF